MLKSEKSKLITAIFIIIALLTVGEACAASTNTFILSKTIEVSDGRLLTV